VFASFYFLASNENRLESPTLGAARRAMTTSLGSICFGSLIIAVIRTIKALIRMAANQGDNNGVGAFLAMCALCIIGCIEQLLEYFNHYAFTQVAIYGKDFCTAAKDTWKLVKERGIDAIINDNLIGNVLASGNGSALSYMSSNNLYSVRVVHNRYHLWCGWLYL
jgi:Na+/melibiose symporter-like transporter